MITSTRYDQCCIIQEVDNINVCTILNDQSHNILVPCVSLNRCYQLHYFTAKSNEILHAIDEYF